MLADILGRYGMLLQEVDSWFASCLRKHGNLITCRDGCSECCRGLFDITVLDAFFLKKGFGLLPLELQGMVKLKAMARLDAIAALWPAFRPPWLLNPIPEAEWDDLMPEADETPCVLLSEEGRCLVYAYRPMTCRLNGIPLIDVSGEELFDEWCTLNFVGVDPLALKELRHPFNELFAQELLLFREMTRTLLGKTVSELDTIIPAALLIEAEMLTVLATGIKESG